MKTSAPLPHVAPDIKLRYVSDKQSGYTRKEKNGKFVYFSDKGKIADKKVLDRIRALVLPPAWQQVWICTQANGHIQATGIDARGRKQYRYHNDWSAFRNLKKFDRLEGFARKLKLLRVQLKKDLRRKKLTKEKVCAIAVNIMSHTYIRAGNKAYEQEYGSFGLTTLKNKHIKIESNKVFFKFKGKKGVVQQVYLKEPKLVKMLKNIKDIPGQELFQYYNKNGEIVRLDSGDINSYLKESMKDDYTCKDFRTWAGCTLALMIMAGIPVAETETERKKNLVHIIDEVASKLGNTRTVTRNYYIHPELQNQYLDQRLTPVLNRIVKKNTDKFTLTEIAEKSFLKFLLSLPSA
ncbi:DNA topoisomerase IB [Sphingobacterium spiritivorum]|uniref:DNA topoisomerase IB n=1 Tax=Sphingobacterium spiritivorum TaxID=258 RepID=UPI003DA57C04